MPGMAQCPLSLDDLGVLPHPVDHTADKPRDEHRVAVLNQCAGEGFPLRGADVEVDQLQREQNLGIVLTLESPPKVRVHRPQPVHHGKRAGRLWPLRAG